MIGRLHGKLVVKEPPALLIDVNGVGYELDAPMTTFYELPAIGEVVTLHTHLVVRDDAHLLYGFSRESQRSLFRSLLKVSGVGPRVALAILSGLTVDEFVACITTEDVARITCVPGIGRKTAERLIVEMRDKVQAIAVAASETTQAANAQVSLNPEGEAVSALLALGYKPTEATRLVRSVDGKDLSTEEIIRQALKSAVG
ncbi:MAG: Holliday junction branch migration protein RuvA [Acidiferrobacterales bacterium]